MTHSLFAAPPLVIAALHLPDFNLSRDRSAAWFEDYALTNARVFADAGIPWIKLQDQTRTDGPAAPETLARMAALARLIRSELPALNLGIIIEAHDPEAALVVAQAAGAGFVRLKVFVGGAMTAQGPRHGLGARAVARRAALCAGGVAILADVHDRTSVPLSGESQPMAAEWAAKTGADGLIVTGRDMDDTLARIAAVRAAGVRRPVLVGGSVTGANVVRALAGSDGVVVSTALMRADRDPGALLQWDADLCARFMEAARAPSAAST
jgi:uncharacterized protein